MQCKQCQQTIRQCTKCGKVGCAGVRCPNTIIANTGSNSCNGCGGVTKPK